MKNLTLEHIAEACQGTYFGPDSMKTEEVSSVTTDSREAGNGALFFAIAGERVDGHRFIQGVYEKGAICCIGEWPLERIQELSESAGAHCAYIQVESTLQALKDVAAFYRQSLTIKVVGIAGSVGKTSTKEIISAVLEQKFQVLKTLGNFNNEIGLPLTIFRLREEHEIAVLEMGISDFGEMHRLTMIAKPDVVVMTNIGYCHLENLKTRDGILQAKSEIFDGIAEDGAVILNGDDDKLSTIKEVKGLTPVFFGLKEQCPYYAVDIQNLGLKGTVCTICADEEEFSVHIPVPGNHMVYNALAAAAVGRQFGLNAGEIKAGIESLKPVGGRTNIIEHQDLTIIDDCYNANPVSMRSAIDVLAYALGRKIAILGDMFELGEHAEDMHREVGRYGAEKEIDVIICVGKLAANIAEGAREMQAGIRVYEFPDRETLLEQLEEILVPGDTVLIKASHGMKFQEVVQSLIQSD